MEGGEDRKVHRKVKSIKSSYIKIQKIPRRYDRII